MSEENKTPNTTVQTIDTAALLKEIDSKISDFSKKVESKLDGLKAPAMPQHVAPAVDDGEDMATLLYSDPQKAIEKITKSVEAKVESRLSSEQRVQQQFGDTYNRLAQDYPEIMKQDSKFHLRARELVAELSEGRAYDSGALERAVFRAANELGIVPSKLRKQPEPEDDDSYSGMGTQTSTSSTKRREKNGLDPRSIAFAQMIGQDVNDPKYIKRLEEIDKKRRGNWKSFK